MGLQFREAWGKTLSSVIRWYLQAGLRLPSPLITLAQLENAFGLLSDNVS